MTSKMRFGLIVLTTLLFATPSFAQDGGKAPFVGVGFNVGDVFSNFLIAAGANSDYNQNIYIPINLTPNLRVEPILMLRSTSSTKFEENTTLKTEVTTDTSSLTLGIGVGGFYMWSLTDNINAYGGGRLMYSRTSSDRQVETITPGNKNTSGRTSSQNGFAFSAAGGTEWFFTKYLSLGGEVQLNFNYLGTPTTELDPNPGDGNMDNDSDTSTTITPGANLFFRFYFM